MTRENRIGNIYYLHPLIVDPAAGWKRHCEQCRALGFDHLAIDPPFAPGPAGDLFLAGDMDVAHPVLCRTLGSDAATFTTVQVVERLAKVCQANSLGLLIDIVPDRIDAKGLFALSNPDLQGRS